MAKKKSAKKAPKKKKRIKKEYTLAIMGSFADVLKVAATPTTEKWVFWKNIHPPSEVIENQLSSFVYRYQKNQAFASLAQRLQTDRHVL